MTSWWARALGISAVSWLLWTAPTRAASGETERERARTLGYAGIRAYAAGNYPSASAQLEESYALLPVPSLGLWSARALVKLGKLVEAEQRYRGVLGLSVADDAPPVQHAARATAELELAELLPRLPALRIRVLGARAEAVVLVLDDVQLETFGGGELHLNPGLHHVVALYGAERSESNVVADEGQSRDLVLTFSAAPPPSAPPDGSASAGHGLRTAGWIALAAGAASLSASVVTYFLGRSEYDELEERGVCKDEVCDREGNLATYDTLRTTHLVTLITGAALGSVGAVVLLSDSGDAAPQPGSARLELRLGPGSSFIAGQF